MSRSIRLTMLALLVVALFLGSLACGKAVVPLSAWFSGDPRWWIVAELRLPRAVLALALGAVLGLSGAVLQGYLRNPLADPGVVGISSPVYFRRRRTRAEVDAFIADAVRTALARTDARRLVVMGQSYGADIVQTGMAHLPAELRARVVGIILVLPGDAVFYRADPTGWAYHGTPDSVGVTTARTLTWTPLTCIYGAEEDDSLCPLLNLPNARKIAMPGGHNINHDAQGLLRHVLAAVGRAERP